MVERKKATQDPDRGAEGTTAPALPDFEAALSELEKIVARLEEGDLTLEGSLNEFERGVALTRTCHQTLQVAEQRVQQLIEEDGQLRFEDFDRPPTPES